ncbi:hypothetical protein CASFOL_019459 [Castilleja foliolosa]|uniref:Thioredoxin domain-containing protein n=1 Tax=Castilleja foliolosa TaxID=1961234 RepID=A0ABD3D4F7_9LAMI
MIRNYDIGSSLIISQALESRQNGCRNILLRGSKRISGLQTGGSQRGLPAKREITFETELFGLKTFLIYVEPVFSKTGETIGVNYMGMEVTDQGRQVIEIRSFIELKVKLRATEKASGLAVLYFTATWCEPCRYMADIGQVISGFAEKYPKVVFLKVDIDEAPFVAAEYKPTLLPSFFFVRNGREIDNYLEVDMDLLQAKLAQNERIGMCVFI